jgi:ABC-type proline/glycine betaine transport system ATPase subunit
MAAVAVNEIRKKFGDVVAVNGISLEARDGEFMVLLGPSGCGKTTLLRIIAGLEKPTSGQVLIDGQVVNDIPPRGRGVAMVFQSYGLYPHLTVWNNIAFPLRTQGTARDEIKRKVEWAAGLLGIDHLARRRPRELSGGERQRVALARALVRDPTVFLLDEPLSNLDAKLRASARSELKQFQRTVRTATIYVTHDQVEAMGMGDRIAVIDHGRLRQVGTPTIYEHPADERRELSRRAAHEPDRARGRIDGLSPREFPAQGAAQRRCSCRVPVPRRPRGIPRLGAHLVRLARRQSRETRGDGQVAGARDAQGHFARRLARVRGARDGTALFRSGGAQNPTSVTRELPP